MELELAKTDKERDRRGKAKDRLDTRTADIGQQILEEAVEAVQPDAGDSTSESQVELYRWRQILTEQNGE